MLQADQVANHSPQTKLGRVSRNGELQQNHASHGDGLRQGYADAALGDGVAVPFEIMLQAIANRDRQTGPVSWQPAPLNSWFHRYQPRSLTIRTGSFVVRLPSSTALLTRGGAHWQGAHATPPRRCRRAAGVSGDKDWHLVTDYRTEKSARAPDTCEQCSCHTAEATAGPRGYSTLLENRLDLRRGTAAIQNPAVLASPSELTLLLGRLTFVLCRRGRLEARPRPGAWPNATSCLTLLGCVPNVQGGGVMIDFNGNDRGAASSSRFHAEVFSPRRRVSGRSMRWRS